MDNKLKVIELFSGIGSQTQALKNIGVEHEVVGISEIDKYSITSYEAIHGKTDNLGDISKIDKLPYCDLLTYSFPCFTKDSLILTENGYKSIEKIKVGEKVLTHKNRYMEVSKTFKNGYKNIFKLYGSAFDEIKTTENHKFLVREKYKEWNNSKRTYERKFKEQEWKEIKHINKNYYLGLAINQNSKIPNWNGVDFKWLDGRKTRHKNDLSKFMNKKVFWWLIGRYLADGWTKQNGIVVAIGKHKSKEFEEKIKENFKYTKIEERTAFKYHFSSKELKEYVIQFGKGASNKKLTKDIFDLPTDLLKSFLDGYLSGDGCIVKNVIKCSSVSRELIYGIGQCIMKVYKRPFSIYKVEKSKTCIIEGRTVNQKSYFNLNFKKEINKQDKAFYENGYVWFPIQKIENTGVEEVFDIEVENDHSFTVQNVIVHNCQDLSLAGKGKGIKKGTRSGLLYEVERLLEIAKVNGTLPKYLLLENVKNLVGKKHKKDFSGWLNTLEELGYSNFWEVLSASDYRTPQKRQRVFVVSILGEGKYIFPKKQELRVFAEDYLDEEFESKYMVSKRLVDCFSDSTNRNGFIRSKIYKPHTLNGKTILRTITTRAGGRAEDNFIQLDPTDKYNVRKLTPLECWRFMGFTDDQFYKAQIALNNTYHKGKDKSNTQLYKQAGNSIVVTVLEEIFKELLLKNN